MYLLVVWLGEKGQVQQTLGFISSLVMKLMLDKTSEQLPPLDCM
jgi:hypothetical protein